MKPQSVVIINTDPNIAKEILKLLGKNGFRATENYDVVDDTKIIVFTK